MDAFSPAMVHGLAELIISIAALVKAIWPKGLAK
jgi:hypothetical protein